jgi:hypothetical protein
MFAAVNVKINGLGNFLKQTKFYTLTAFGRFKSSEGRYRVSHARTLRKTGRTGVGVHTSNGTGKIVMSLVANDKKVFKIVTFGPIRKQSKLKVSQLGRVGKV